MIRSLLRVLDADGGPLRRLLAALVVAGVLQGIGFVLLVPLLRALLEGDLHGARPWLGAELAVVALYAVLHYRGQLDGYLTAFALSEKLFRRLGDQVARLPLGWFSADRTGQVSRMASHGVIDVMGLPAHTLRPLVYAVVTPLTVGVGMFLFDWQLALITVVAAPVALVVFRWSGTNIERNERALHAASVRTANRLLEFARAQPVLRTAAAAGRGRALVDETLLAQHRAYRQFLLRGVLGLVAFGIVVQATYTAMVLVGIDLAIDGTVLAAELVALLVLATRFVEPLSVAAELGGSLRVARGSLSRMDELMATALLPEAEAASPAVFDGSIELRDVTFAYADRRILDGVSLRAEPGSVTALVGPSGSGKTTVTRLIARFWDVDTGTVLVGGHDVRAVSTSELMSQLAMVFQDVFLFDDTVEANVRVGRPDATDDEVRRAIEAARVDEIAARLPDGLASRVGEGGTSLSGGERQRVSIARALLKDAPIVLLDEATSALDAENEAFVHEALRTLTRGRTVLVIAHRLHTVQAADRIIVLDERGGVDGTGTHDELLAAGGRYAAFCAARSRAEGWRITR